MGPVLPLAAAGVALLFLATRKSGGASSPGGRDPVTGIRSGTGKVFHVKGKSGTEYDTQIVEASTKPLDDGGSVVVAVILNDPKIPARRHMVIEYLQTGSAKSTPKQVRTLVAKGPSTLGVIQAAIADFAVTGPAAQAAANGL